MDSSWIAVGISVLVVLGGTGANLFIMGRQVGQMNESMRNTASTLKDFKERLDEVGDMSAENAQGLSLVDQRVKATEAATGEFWKMRDAFTAMKTTAELEGKYAREKLESMDRSLREMGRTLANAMHTRLGGAGLMTTDEGKGEGR